MSEPPSKHYARGMLPLSPTAKKGRENKNWPGTGHLSELKRDVGKERYSFDKKDKKRRDLVIGVKPHNTVQENGPQTQNNRNAMLKRLADCFAYRQMTVKSRAKRHRVMGFRPRLCTIHENASELANDLDATFNSLISDTDLTEFNTQTHSPMTKDSIFERSAVELTSCCQRNDQAIAGLHEDIKELWTRLENVEKDFAWARGSLLTISSKDANYKSQSETRNQDNL